MSTDVESKWPEPTFGSGSEASEEGTASTGQSASASVASTPLPLPKVSQSQGWGRSDGSRSHWGVCVVDPSTPLGPTTGPVLWLAHTRACMHACMHTPTHPIASIHSLTPISSQEEADAGGMLGAAENGEAAAIPQHRVGLPLSALDSFNGLGKSRVLEWNIAEYSVQRTKKEDSKMTILKDVGAYACASLPVCWHACVLVCVCWHPLVGKSTRHQKYIYILKYHYMYSRPCRERDLQRHHGPVRLREDEPGG